jgi:hypothetical protein
MQYYIYLGENPTNFIGIEEGVKKGFMIALDEDENAQRIKEFTASGKLMSIDKKVYDDFKKQGIDRKRNEVFKWLEQSKIPSTPKPNATKRTRRKGNLVI